MTWSTHEPTSKLSGSNTWMGRTRIDGPNEFEPSKFDCKYGALWGVLIMLNNNLKSTILRIINPQQGVSMSLTWV